MSVATRSVTTFTNLSYMKYRVKVPQVTKIKKKIKSLYIIITLSHSLLILPANLYKAVRTTKNQHSNRYMVFCIIHHTRVVVKEKKRKEPTYFSALVEKRVSSVK